MGNYSQGQMIGIGIAFMILPTIAVAARLWAKRLCRKGVMPDDYLILVALAFQIACCVTQLVAAIDGQLGQHQTVGPDGQPLLRDPKFLIYEKCKFASQIMGTVGLGVTKASVLVFYTSIFSVRRFKLWAYVMLLLVIGWTISFFFSNLFTCYPITPLVEQFYGNKCLDSLSMWYASCITDFITDIMILLTPIPMVLKLKVHWHQKLAIQGMFALGALVCAISVTRFVMYWKVGHSFLKHFNDETYWTSPVFFWTNIEISLSVVSACLPIYRPIWLYLKGTPVATKNSYNLRSYSRFDPRHSPIATWPKRDSLQSEELRGISLQPEVHTVVQGGQDHVEDHLDISSITVAHDLYTESKSR